jgi:hypothetical protein
MTDTDLQLLMANRHSYTTRELAEHLRFSMNRGHPTWQHLLNASIELAHLRGERPEDIFQGLMPRQADPDRNTGQPVYKPHQT